MFRTGKSVETESRLELARDCGEKRGSRVAVNRSGVSFRSNGNVPELDNGDGCTIL